MVRYRINGPLVKKLRLSKGATQYQMAIECDLEISVISRIETGVATASKCDTLKKIATYFDMAMESFMVMED